MAQTITIDLTPDGRRIFQRPYLHFSQGDVGQDFVINLKSRFGLEIPAGATVKIEATKPSGFGFSETGVLSNQTATFTTAAVMTDEAGHFPVELSITASGKILGTANFNFMVEPDPHPEGTIDGQAEEVVPELTQLVERVEDAASSVLDRQTVTNTLPAGSQASYSFDEETNTQTFGIPQGEAGAGAVDVTASAYSSSKTYAVDDYVIHNDYLYRCTTAITTAEAWTSGHWTQVLLGNEVSDVKSNINSKFGFKNIVDKTMFETGDAKYSGSGYTTTRRWFINHVFPKGTTIEKINFGCSGNSTNPNRVQNFEIWEKSNDTLTKVKTVSVDVSQTTAQQQVKYFDAEINYTSANDCMISWISTGTPSSLLYTIDGDGNDNVIVSTDTSLDTTSLLYSSLATFLVKTLPDMEVTYSSHKSVNIVTIGEGMDYEEIQPALLAITDDSPTNPYTLLVMPKATPYQPFTMLRNSFSDTYPWNNIAPRHISIIGIDKAHCIIRSDSGNYKKPCGEPLTNGVIKNLTFIMTNDEQDPTATQGGYCLHIDCRTLNDVGYNMTIEDCDFECASGPCLGIGMHEDCNLKIKRCNFKTTLSASYAPHEGYRNLCDFGCIFTHTSPRADAQNQRITFEDCVGVCNEGNKSLQIASAGSYDPSTAEFTYTLLRNVFWNVASNLPKYSISNNLTANPMNFGNNN